VVRKNIIECIQLLLCNLKTGFTDYSKRISSPDLIKQVTSLGVCDSKADILQDPKAFESAANQIQSIWKDPLFQKTLQDYPNKFPSLSSAQYFLSHLDSLTTSSYVPSELDIMRCREPTLGLIETTVQIAGTGYRFLCMRGSKGQRRKWLPSFGAGEESIAAVMFVSSLDEYNETHANSHSDLIKEELLLSLVDYPPIIVQTITDYMEEESISKLKDSIDFFEEICANKYYEHVGIALLLNRRESFNQKLKKEPLSKYFHGFHEDGSSHAAVLYIENLFKEKNKHTARQIYTFSTDAIDKASVSQVMSEILHSLHGCA